PAQEERLSESILPVALLDRFGLARQVERLPGGAGGDQVVGALLEGVQLGGRRLLIGQAGHVVQDARQSSPARQAIGGNSRREREVVEHVAGALAACHAQRRVGRSQALRLVVV